MNRQRLIKLLVPLVLLAIVAAALTWTLRARAAAATQPPEDPVLRFLDVSPKDRDAIVARDQAFSEDLQRLRSDLDKERVSLATLLEKPGTSDAAIRKQVEAVITANEAMQRRVMEHVLAIREHLTPAQQERLLNLCAQGLRQGPGWRWRGGSSANEFSDEGRGTGPGYGGGRGFRGGRGPATSGSR